jgi:hypothetical protein
MPDDACRIGGRREQPRHLGWRAPRGGNSPLAVSRLRLTPRSLLPAVCCLVWLACVAGCGRPYPSSVSGTVTLDGKQLSCGTVTFYPEAAGVPGYGAIGGEGGYAIHTAGRPGLTPGKYRATVVAAEPAVMPASGDMPVPGKSIVPSRYSSVQTSGLRYTVQPGVNRFDIEVSSK